MNDLLPSSFLPSSSTLECRASTLHPAWKPLFGCDCQELLKEREDSIIIHERAFAFFDSLASLGTFQRYYHPFGFDVVDLTTVGFEPRYRSLFLKP